MEDQKQVEKSPTTTGNEPIELITPIGGVKVLIKPFVTGRIRFELRETILREMTVSGKSEEARELTFTPDVMLKGQRRAVELLVISVDGKTDKVLDTVLDMHEEDAQAVFNAVEKLARINDISEQKKTN